MSRPVDGDLMKAVQLHGRGRPTDLKFGPTKEDRSIPKVDNCVSRDRKDSPSRVSSGVPCRTVMEVAFYGLETLEVSCSVSEKTLCYTQI